MYPHIPYPQQEPERDPTIVTNGLPPEIIAALKQLGYPTSETPMSNSDRVDIFRTPETPVFQQVVEPSQQLADNFSEVLARQRSAETFEQPYIPYLQG